MTSADLKVNLIVNKLTRTQYNELQTSGLIDSTQLYDIIDATKLSDYGITDAKISNGTITLGSNAITPLTSHQSLTAYETKADLTTNYYKKTETSSSTQVANALTSLSNDLSTYTETMVAGVAGDIPLSVSQLVNDSGYTTNVGTITGITMNGSSKGTSGVVNLGTVITAHQSLTNYYTKSQTSSAAQISTALDGKQASGDYLLSSDLSFAYDSSTKKINLKAFGTNTIGTVDCSDFIKDGMLSNVIFDKTTNKLVFYWNTDAGLTNISVALSSLVDKATTLAGYGITDAKIENGVITLGTKTITPLTAHQSLANYYQKTETSSAAQIKNALNNISSGTIDYIDGVSSDLSINNVTEAQMAEILEAGDLPTNAIYLVSSDTENMFGQRVTNVGTPTSSTDAATKGYVDQLLSGKTYDLSQNGKFTQLVVDIGKALGATITNYTASDGESNTYGS